MAAIDADILSAGGVRYTQTEPQAGHTLHLVTLAKDKTLNALTPATFHALHKILDVVHAPSTVVLHGTGRAFSAGGDVRALRTKLLDAGAVGSKEREEAAGETLKIEYDFLRRFHTLGNGSHGVRTAGVCDGYAFGAGLGLLQACSVRMVTKRAVFAMPEVRIGLIPDCGATWFYTRMGGCVGMYAALTGCRISAGDAIALGLADDAVDEGWEDRIGAGGVRELASASVVLERGDLSDAKGEFRRRVDECFSAPSLDEITERVRGIGGEWGDKVIAEMRLGSPRALRECFDAIREGYRGGGLEEALCRELRVDAELAAGWDFEEGVRAALVDKDNAPKWH